MLNRMNKLNLLLICAIFVGVVLRIYLLGSIPAGLTNDEADIGYDAYSLLLTGKDQWGESFPLVNFKGFGDYRPVLYTYLVAPFILVFDLSSVAVRLPSAIFGSLSIISIYLLGRRLFNKETGVIAALLFSISPWSIGLSRIGIESNVAVFLLTLGLYFLLGFKKSNKSFYAGIVLLALTIYCYSAYLLFSILVLGVFFIFYRLDLFKRKNTLIAGIAMLVILLSPILLNNLTAKTRLSQVSLVSNINSIGLVDGLNLARGACLQDFPPMVCKIIGNKYILFVHEFGKNYFSHFSFSFLFFNGTDTQFSILHRTGLQHAFEIFFFLAGLFVIFSKRTRESILVFTLFAISAIPDSITGEGNYSRAFMMQPFLILIEAMGLMYLVLVLKKIKNSWLRNTIYAAGLMLILVVVVSFLVNYLTDFKRNYSLFSQYGYKELMNNVYGNRNKYDSIYITRHLNDTKQYIYYLFFNKYDPVKFQNKQNIEFSQSEDGWIEVGRIDNIYFVGNLSGVNIKKLDSDNVLLISHPSEFSKDIVSIAEIKDLSNDVKFKEVELLEYKKYLKSRE